MGKLGKLLALLLVLALVLGGALAYRGLGSAAGEGSLGAAEGATAGTEAALGASAGPQEGPETGAEATEAAQAGDDGAPAAAPAGKLERVTAYTYDGSREETVFLYDRDGRLLQVVPDSGAVTAYQYDDQGNLRTVQRSDCAVPAVEYHYDGGVLTGCTRNEVYGDTVLSTVVYEYQRDEEGNVAKISGQGDEDLWTLGEYHHDQQGRRVSALELERYGDHEFERTITYDHSHPGAVVARVQESLFGQEDRYTLLQFGALDDGPVYEVRLYEGYTLESDADGYVTAVLDQEGQPVQTFSYTVPGAAPEAVLTFADIPEDYLFTSGAGAWMTTLTLSPDGSFTGAYTDSDAGESGPGYRSTVYYSEFSGQFSGLEQVNAYTYAMTLTAFQTAQPEGEERIENDIRYVAANPSGFDGPEAFFLYLPGIPDALAPQSAYNWVRLLYGGEGSRDVYVICSANGECPFMGTFD